MKNGNNNFTLEKRLYTLQASSEKNDLSINEILKILSGKGRSLIIIFLALPFCQPIQIPGFSAPFGLAISFFGLRLAFGKNVWLPKKILEKKIHQKNLKKLTHYAIWVVEKCRPWIQPRLLFLSRHPVMKIFNGLLIAFLGLVLALPLPIPLSNMTAAWSIFLISLGILEDDGVFILLGYFVALVTSGFFAAIFFSLKWLF